MDSNQGAAIVCLSVCLIYIILAAAFALMKEKGAILISGFNTMSKEKRAQYDKIKMSKDIRNKLLLWAVIMFIGGILSYFISFLFAIISFIIWFILFLKEVRIDPDKAFEKYRK